MNGFKEWRQKKDQKSTDDLDPASLIYLHPDPLELCWRWALIGGGKWSCLGEPQPFLRMHLPWLRLALAFASDLHLPFECRMATPHFSSNTSCGDHVAFREADGGLQMHIHARYGECNSE